VLELNQPLSLSDVLPQTLTLTGFVALTKMGCLGQPLPIIY